MTNKLNIDKINLTDIPSFLKETKKQYWIKETYSLLEAINNDINNIDFETELENDINIDIDLLRNYMKVAISTITKHFLNQINKYSNLDIEYYHLMTKGFWSKLLKVIPRIYIRAIKRILIKYEILQVKKGINYLHIINHKTLTSEQLEDSKLCESMARSMSYRINPKYLNINKMNNRTTIEQAIKYLKSELENCRYNEQIIFTKQIINQLTGKHISDEEMFKIVDERLEDAKVVNRSSVKSPTVKHRNTSYNSDYIGTDVLFRKAERTNSSVIKWNNEYLIISNLEGWKENKRIDLFHIYTRAYNDIINHTNIYVSVNDTNNRLDSPLTNIKQDLIKYLQLDGEYLGEFDVSNMQPALLVMLAEDNSIKLDEHYIQWATEGTIYENVSKLLGISRNETKYKFMHSFFSQTEDEDMIEIFPLAMNYIADFKKNNKKNEFPNTLTRYESDIMIDRVLRKLIANNVKCLTRHDSVIFKMSDKQKVYDLIKEVFRLSDFKCKLRFTELNKIFNKYFCN